MSKTLPRLLGFAALAWIASGPTQAAPKNPPPPPPRPVFPGDSAMAPNVAGPAPASEPAPQAVAAPNQPAATRQVQEDDVPGFALAEQAGLAEITRRYARRHGLPLALLHRIIMRESRYHPRLVNRSFYGLMQIAPATARSMGYRGSPRGLLDPETNLAYGAPYLANAWALSNGDMDRAVTLYASGYYFTAKRRHMLGQLRNANSPPVGPAPRAAVVSQAPPPPPPPPNIFGSLFGEQVGSSRTTKDSRSAGCRNSVQMEKTSRI